MTPFKKYCRRLCLPLCAVMMTGSAACRVDSPEKAAADRLFRASVDACVAETLKPRSAAKGEEGNRAPTTILEELQAVNRTLVSSENSLVLELAGVWRRYAATRDCASNVRAAQNEPAP